MAQGVHKITKDFEEELSKYTGAKYVIALDNMSNALFLALYYEKNIKKNVNDVITIPARTYPSVPCEIIHAGLKVNFTPVKKKYSIDLYIWTHIVAVANQKPIFKIPFIPF
jgi:dTDP-4-amino-4,6-dideoxygalactose transaminase